MGPQLTTYELLVKLDIAGMLDELTSRGIVNKKIHTYYKYYREIQFLQVNFTLNDAVMKGAGKLNVSERTLWRALKALKS